MTVITVQSRVLHGTSYAILRPPVPASNSPVPFPLPPVWVPLPSHSRTFVSQSRRQRRCDCDQQQQHRRAADGRTDRQTDGQTRRYRKDLRYHSIVRVTTDLDPRLVLETRLLLEVLRYLYFDCRNWKSKYK